MTTPFWLRLLPAPIRDQLAGRRAVQDIIANSGWLLLDRAVRIALGVVVGAWVARYLGPGKYGELAYVIAYIAIFQAVANLGADAIVVRDLARNQAAAPQILGSAVVLRLIVGVACWLLAMGGMAWMGDGQSLALVAVVGGVLVFQAADTVDLWFQSQSQSRRTVVAKLLACLISNGAKVVLISVEAPLVAFAVIVTFDALASALGLIVAYRRFPTQGKWRILYARCLDLLRESWPFMLSGLSIMVYMRIDQIMLKEMIGDRALGLYAAMLPLSQLMQIVPIILATSLAPTVSRMKTDNNDAYVGFLVILFRFFFYMGLLGAIVVFFAAPYVIRLLFGAEYTEAIAALRVHVFSNPFCFLGIAHGLWLVNERRFAVRLYGTMGAGLITVAGNALLIPRIGIMAACYTAIASQLVAAVLINALLDRKSFNMQIKAVLFIGQRKC